MQLAVYGKADHTKGQNDKGAGDRLGDKGHPVALGEHQAAAQIGLCSAAQNKAEDERCRGNVEAAEHIADHAEQQHGTYVKNTAGVAIGAHGAEGKDHGQQHVLGNGQNLYKNTQTVEFDQDHHDRSDDHSGEDRIDQICMVGKEQGTGRQLMECKAAQQNGGNGVTGNAQREQRDHCTADRGVVGALGGNDTIHNAGTEQLGMLGLILGHNIGENVGCTAADAGENADTDTDQGRAEEVGELLPEFLHAETEALDALGVGCGDRKAIVKLGLLSGVEQLGYGKQADEHGQRGEAAHQSLIAKGKADRGVNGRNAHSGKHKAQYTGKQALDHGAAGQCGDHGQGEKGDSKIFKKAEACGDLGQGGGNENQCENTEHRTQEGENDAAAQRLHALAPLHHGIAVPTGGYRGGSAGDLDQNSGDQAAGDGTDIQAHHERKGRDRFHAVGNGKK